MMRVAFALYGKPAGVISRDGGTMGLNYYPEYLAAPTATPLSLSLPLSTASHPARPIEAFLRGLLPDHAEVRRRWAEAFGLRDRDTLGLIAAIGMDCAGGAIFATEDRLSEALERPGSIVPFSEEEIGRHLARLRLDDAAWHDTENEHWSLAGGQSKFTVAKTDDGAWGKPLGAAPSTHIIKPGISRIPAQALVEHVSMRSLALLGENVATSEYREFAGEPAVVVKRFDRLTDRADKPLRLHSEDLVQSFGLDPERKYEAKKGPGVAKIIALLRQRADEGSATRFIRAIIINYLLGAPDAHAKNYSVLLVGRQVTLAPLYDVASGFIADPITGMLRYPRHAMSIGGETCFGEVGSRQWSKFAATAGLTSEEVLTTVSEIATSLPDALSDAIKELPGKPSGIKILKKELLPRVALHSKHTLTLLNSTETSRTLKRGAFFDSL
ncbi:MAG: type II toxin-antitoxin system HipA family toxin [Coriobacteriales bacterium]|jgi:serine/threonine-protein kinase HipA|nr:type II toxin-antitoxin system HipA family toxin [Coriobacteriales bacterium]